MGRGDRSFAIRCQRAPSSGDGPRIGAGSCCSGAWDQHFKRRAGRLMAASLCRQGPLFSSLPQRKRASSFWAWIALLCQRRRW